MFLPATLNLRKPPQNPTSSFVLSPPSSSLHSVNFFSPFSFPPIFQFAFSICFWGKPQRKEGFNFIPEFRLSFYPYDVVGRRDCDARCHECGACCQRSHWSRSFFSARPRRSSRSFQIHQPPLFHSPPRGIFSKF